MQIQIHIIRIEYSTLESIHSTPFTKYCIPFIHSLTHSLSIHLPYHPITQLPIHPSFHPYIHSHLRHHQYNPIHTMNNIHFISFKFMPFPSTPFTTRIIHLPTYPPTSIHPYIHTPHLSLSPFKKTPSQFYESFPPKERKKSKTPIHPPIHPFIPRQ